MKNCGSCYYFSRPEDGPLDPDGEPMTGCGMDINVITQINPATGEVLATSEVLETDEACPSYEPA